jgi:predicted Zn-dependent peptidase
LIETSVLPCGIRLVTETMADVRSVAMAYWVGSGSRDESDELAGASHFLEHLLFKGTDTRSAVAIAESLDEVGGDCNAFTTKEYTTFYVRLLSEHLPLGLDILSEIMWTPALRPVDVDAERTVILDEILMHADEPSDLAAEEWQAALFPGHSLGRDTLGTATTVADLTDSDIRVFFEHHYRPANMVVSAAGDLSHQAVADDLERRFAGQIGGTAPERQAPNSDVLPLHVVRRPTEQAHVVYGVRSIARNDERRWALAVLNHVLGGGLSSRLFQKVREERGLAYSIWSERAAYQDAGSLAVVAGTAPEHVDEVLRIVAGELELLAEHGITDRELAVAKGNLRAELLLSGEDSGARMSRIGASMLLHGEIRPINDVLAHIEAVGLDDVAAEARALAESPRTLSAVGPLDEEALATHVPALSGR